MEFTQQTFEAVGKEIMEPHEESDEEQEEVMTTEEWFESQGFEGTSWNYVLDQAEVEFKCSFNSEMKDEERLIHDCLYKLWNKLKHDEESDEEEERMPTEKWFEEQDYDECVSWNQVLDDAEEYYCVDFCESEHKEQHDELYELWKDFNEQQACAKCEQRVSELEYLPSKEDQEQQQLLGSDYCLECYKKVEKYDFIENIPTILSKTRNYTNCLTLEQMEYLDLFDEIPYKVVKKIVKLDNETDFKVEINDLKHDDYNKRFTSFKFTLEIDVGNGPLHLVEKHYCVIKEYDVSSPMAMFIDENLVYGSTLHRMTGY